MAVVREARRELGVLGDVAVHISTTMAGDSSKSADWNADFRAGGREELAR